VRGGEMRAKRPSREIDEKKAEAFIKGASAETKQHISISKDKYTDRYTRATWYVEKPKIKAMKQLALDTNRDTSDLVREAIEDLIKKYSSRAKGK
jgi:competence CoiA-like predicted nuclease